MASETELKAEFRVLAYSAAEMPETDLDALISRAKKHLATATALTVSDDWYATGAREEALFWYTCLFAKVATGELDAQDVQVGAIDVHSLLAKDDEEVTTWYRNAVTAKHSIETDSDAAYGQGIVGVERKERVYGGDDDDSVSLG